MNSKIKLIEPDYEGLSKALFELEKLYKVRDNTELLDECLRELCIPRSLITHNN